MVCGGSRVSNRADSREVGFALMSSEVRPVIHSLFEVSSACRRLRKDSGMLDISNLGEDLVGEASKN